MITADSTTSASSERLWALVSDIERWAEMLPTVTSVRAVGSTGSDGSIQAVGTIGTGSRFEVRQPGLASAVWEVTEWRAGRFSWMSRSPGVVTTATHSVCATGLGSRLDLTLEWGGWLAPVVRRIYGGRVAGMVELEAQTFANLAQRP